MDLAELLSLSGVKEECVLRSGVGFMALHGGSQDRGTDQIASGAAEQAGAVLLRHRPVEQAAGASDLAAPQP